MGARRSHPPSLQTIARRFFVDHAPSAGQPWAGTRLLVACSGGPDSTALLHVLARLARPLGLELYAHGVDHGLRADAQRELALAASLAERLGVPFTTTVVQVAPGSNLQARARAARREALVAVARREGAAFIATGHTADDRAETVLIRLLSGAGPRGLAAMPAVAPREGEPTTIRPILEARRADVLLHLQRQHIPFAEDPSNANRRFLRARVRHEILPALAELSPNIVAHLCALSDMLAAIVPADDPLSELGRGQRIEVERARRLGRQRVSLRGPEGQTLHVCFANGRAMVTREG